MNVMNLESENLVVVVPRNRVSHYGGCRLLGRSGVCTRRRCLFCQAGLLRDGDAGRETKMNVIRLS
jgi:hypothetical protein